MSPAATQAPPERASDRRLAELILDLMPLMGRFMTEALREQDAPSLERMRLITRVANGPIRAGELAQSCLLSAATVSQLVESLVQDGYLRREEDPTDRRAVVIDLTESGTREYHRVRAALGRRIVQRLSELTAERRARLALAFTDLHDVFAAPATSKEAQRHVR